MSSLRESKVSSSANARWTIVLAGGDGRRLHPLTRALHGEDLPKQFAAIQPRRSLLQTTLDRTRRWCPPERTIVVVAANREYLARKQLVDEGPVDIVAQPRNLGTGPGILLPLSRVMARDPGASVVVVPSDHYVRDVEPLVDSVLRAEATARRRGSIALVGAVPDRAETQYGWIITAKKTGADVISRFCEKPSPEVADILLRQHALWNTFIMAGAAEVFWSLARKHLPVQTQLFESYRRVVGENSEEATLTRLYESMPAADFSRDVLERARGLRVVSLLPCGWSDWGTPERVLNSLRGTDQFRSLVARLKGTAAAPLPSATNPRDAS